MNYRNLQWKVLVVLISTYISLVNANPIVDGDTIRWTEPGWYQVQSADTLESICEGGTHCEVPGGSYIVINHTSGERWEDLIVADSLSNQSGNSEPIVSQGRIEWTGNDWFQVQRTEDLTTVCEGGNFCAPGPGTYIVINHSTGQRFESVVIPTDSLAIDTQTVPTLQPSVSGNTISWPDNGWYQVQNVTDFSTVCEGSNSCSVDAGTYVVINHTTGERFENIEIGEDAESTDTDIPLNTADDEQTSSEVPFVISDLTIRFNNNDWYQVQSEPDFISVCEGMPSCELMSGSSYTVINHSSGHRYSGISIDQSTGSANSAILSEQEIQDLFATPVFSHSPIPIFDPVWHPIYIAGRDEKAEFSLRATTKEGLATLEIIESSQEFTFSEEAEGKWLYTATLDTDHDPYYEFHWLRVRATHPTRPHLQSTQLFSYLVHSPPEDESDFLLYPIIEYNWFEHGIVAGQPLIIPFNTYLDNQTADVTANLLPQGASLIDVGSGRSILTWTPTREQLGTHFLSIVAQNPDFPDQKSNFEATVTVQNDCHETATTSEVNIDCLRLSNEGFQIHTNNYKYALKDFAAFPVGDINGDGFIDTALQTPTEDSQTPYPTDATIGFILYGGQEDLSQISAFDQIQNGRGLKIVEKDASVNEVQSNLRNIYPANDVNNDGFDDFIVSYGSTAYLIFGKTRHDNDQVVFNDMPDGESIHIKDIDTTTRNPYFSFFNAGDLNEDGDPDLALFRNKSNHEPGREILVFLGGLDFTSSEISLNNLNPSDYFSIESETFPSDIFGVELLAGNLFPSHFLRNLGDFNGDGIDDLLLQASKSGELRQDALLVLFGRADLAGKVVLGKLTPGSYVEYYLPRNMEFEGGIQGGGDFNGDGLSDIVFTVAADGTGRGMTVVIPGNSDSQDQQLNIDNPASFGGWTIEGTNLPMNIARLARDFNHDGFDDLLINVKSEIAVSDPVERADRVSRAEDYDRIHTQNTTYQINGSAAPQSLKGTNGLESFSDRSFSNQFHSYDTVDRYRVYAVPDLSGDEIPDIIIIDGDNYQRPRSYSIIYGQ